METPYRKVDKEEGRVTDEIVYLTADEEDTYNHNENDVRHVLHNRRVRGST